MRKSVPASVTSLGTFASRHIGPRGADIPKMLATIGADNIDTLIDETVPPAIRLKQRLQLPSGASEADLIKELRSIATKNELWRTYIGLGYSNTLVPAVIQRNVLENPGWYTQYTPYQAEISQGRLEALLNFQTMVADLTGLPVANASLLDEATAAAEAMTLLHRARSKDMVATNAATFFVDEHCYPQTIAVLETRALPLGITVHVGKLSEFPAASNCFGLLVQYPGAHGAVVGLHEIVAQAKARAIPVAVGTDLLALTMLASPGDCGADIAFGNTQRFGVPLGYGGPHAAFFATSSAYMRSLPGRIIGVSIDSQGKPALRMSLQTREQHIRREKATSNICTAQALLAVMASMYAVYHGPEGLKHIATTVHDRTRRLEQGLLGLGYRQCNPVYFDTLCLQTKDAADIAAIRANAEAKRINLRYESSCAVIALDETTSEADLDDLLHIFATATASKSASTVTASLRSVISGDAARTSPFLTHPVFHRYHSETELMRYLKRLENKDLSLTTAMIPLGSCTMKLNAAAEMQAVSWPEFGQLHPFAPREQAKGYGQIFETLSNWLCDITGFAACSLQPNSGAQGEYAGLLAIRNYFKDRGEEHRDVALLPASAHGTNPASAALAGMRVVVVRCDERGNVDLEDMAEKAKQHSSQLAVCMITYPSTHGVYEEGVQKVCEIVHQHGGQVYMDGANMNAQVGLTNPATIGADVCHINLHKTFSIPHGGGGPGMGPICVAKHLASYLPGHPVIGLGLEKTSAVSAAPWGSASILLISYAYIRMLGAEGVTDASKFAILNANYIKARLAPHFKVLYEGKNGRVAHELIIDAREFKKQQVEVEDIAKRLMDYGFHAPTMSFPVAGTLMIEPTESESLAELDRFCDAMIAIKGEIDAVAQGTLNPSDNPLKNAPHTAQVVIADDWKHAYSREQAAYPLPYLREQKFWPSVGRVDNAYGDRNVMCTCPDISTYM